MCITTNTPHGTVALRADSRKSQHMQSESNTRKRSAANPGSTDAAPVQTPSPTDGFWLLPHKARVPDSVLGYVERPRLEARCSPLQRRLTVLHAPGGFGKTTLLAHACHRLCEEGLAVAWVSVDEEDGPMTLASYLSLAFEYAGVSLFDTGSADAGSPPDYGANDAADSPADYRITLVLRAIQRHDDPCVLVLDELDRLRSPEAVALLNTVLARAPRNLRFALAFRERPEGLDLAMFTLEGRGETLTAEDLRFSTAQIRRFFDTRLSRGQLASVAALSAGWPIALRLYRNALQSGTAVNELGTSDTVAAWIESRLWRGLSEEDRQFVLDISLFEWFDARLIDEATGRRHSKLRLGAMASLNGLLQTVGGDRSALRLHPLIREYCTAKLYRDDPARFRSIHIGIARALAARGQVLDALHHAAEAGDSELLGAIAEQAGGVKLWIRRGTDALRALNRCLTADVLATRPRLALVRCVALTAEGDIEGARRVYHAAAMNSAGFTRDGAGEQDEELQTDHLVAMGMLTILGCNPLPRYEQPMEVASDMAGRPDLDPLLRGMVKLGMSMANNERGEFDRAVEGAESARADLGPTALYMLPQIDYQIGLAAMARGRSRDAARHYERGLNVAQSHLGDTGTVMNGGFLQAELRLERCAGAPTLAITPVSPRLLSEYAAWFDVYAAGTAVAWELAWHRGSPDIAMKAIEQALEFARATERAALVRFLCAERVSLLLLRGRTQQAARAWRTNRLPDSDAACLDLGALRWREMEAIACARLRLLTAQGKEKAARTLADDLLKLVAEHTLARTRMRALALAAQLETEAGDPARAAEHIEDALRLYLETGYARPLARARDAVLPLLERIIQTAQPGRIEQIARALRSAINAQDADPPGQGSGMLSRKEFDVLRRLDSHTDKKIAAELGMSYDAVRYYVRKIFARVGARNRFEAVHRARAMGLLPSEEAANALGR